MERCYICQLFGIDMVSIDVLKNFSNGSAIFFAVSFKNFGCIWSGPEDFVSFNFSRCSCIFLLSDFTNSRLWIVVVENGGIPCVESVGGGGYTVLPLSVCLSFRPSKIFFVAFFSVTVDGRNLIFGHKRHIGIPYCEYRFWTRQIPTS